MLISPGEKIQKTNNSYRVVHHSSSAVFIHPLNVSTIIGVPNDRAEVLQFANAKTSVWGL